MAAPAEAPRPAHSTRRAPADERVGEPRSTEASTEVPLVPREGFFEGQVAILAETRVEGTVLGTLRGPGKLILGSEARVEGVIECDVLSSEGEIIGPVVVRKRVELLAGARFEGDLEAPAATVDDDVIWNGVARIGR